MRIQQAITLLTDNELIELGESLSNPNLIKESIYNRIISSKSGEDHPYYAGLPNWIEMLECVSTEMSIRLKSSNSMRCKCD